MAEHPERATPKLARTDFESMTHEQLAALIDAASSEGASHLAGKLSKAASTITKIGDDLMTHVKGLEWQGEGGDAFRDWGGQTAGSTLRLGQYAEVASRWMETVAQAVAEAKAAMPKVSETTQAKADLAEAKGTIAAARQPGSANDPDARKLAQTARTDATAAQGRIEAARGEAIQQLRKLAQAYEYSAQQVNSVQPPTFSPPAEHMRSDEWKDTSSGVQYASLGSSGSAGTHGVASEGGTSGAGDRPHPTTHQSTHTVRPMPVAPAPDRSHTASMEIDGTSTLPHHTSPSATAPVGPQTGAPRPDVVSPTQPGTVPPLYTGGGGGQGSGMPTRTPSGMRPVVGGPGQGISNGGVPRMPREAGIVGGRPVAPSGRPTGGIPRGTVIGGNGAQGRTPMMRGMTPSTPSTNVGGQGGAAGGRRLASETGGVVGNRPSQPGRSGARAFTPGGSGLVRRADSAAHAGHGPTGGRTGSPTGRASAKGRDEQRGQRPEYLVEEEETWAPANRRAVPPVVD
ncbi:WXG100 family type VII secretion target [Streptomyces sp. NPDC001500]